ncbi:MAG: hypothetical protein OXE86_12940 [Alphaproteobacteria bacterium]|nr:hypothetical protein [Alphaproteobacteria bacterium]
MNEQVLQKMFTHAGGHGRLSEPGIGTGSAAIPGVFPQVVDSRYLAIAADERCWENREYPGRL